MHAQEAARDQANNAAEARARCRRGHENSALGRRRPVRPERGRGRIEGAVSSAHAYQIHDEPVVVEASAHGHENGERRADAHAQAEHELGPEAKREKAAD